MNALGRVLTALTISLALVGAGYVLGTAEPEPGLLVALIIALIIGAAVAFVRSERRDAAALVLMHRNDPAGPPSVVDREVARARRLQRPLALLRATLPDDGERHLAEIQHALSREDHSPVRLTDHAWVERGAVFVVFPDAGRQAAELAWGRLRRAIPALGDRARIVVFPEDGVTLGGLLEQLATPPARSLSDQARDLVPAVVEARTKDEAHR